MSGFLESFFDDNQPGFKLWSKKLEGVDLKQENRIYGAQMYKLSRKNGKWKPRFFVLTTNYLIYYKDETEGKVRGIINLSWVRNEYITDGHQSNKDYQYGVRFIKNMKYSDLWLKEEDHFKKWKDALSKVYLVEKNETKEKFAVKAFSKDYLMSQNKGKESLVNEIEIMKQLTHPNVMRLEEVHESQNSIYLIMELLEGGELFNYITDKGNLKPAEYCKVMKNMLDGLAYMDLHGVMHRDLKPENMILKFKNSKLILLKNPLRLTL